MTMNVDDLEVLAWMALGFDQRSAMQKVYDRNNPEEELGWDLDGALEHKFGCNFSGFCVLAEALLLLTPVIEDAKTGEKNHAFIDSDGDSIIKTEA